MCIIGCGCSILRFCAKQQHLWIWRRQDPGNFNLIDLSCLDCLLVKIDFAAEMKIATKQNFWSERLILSLKKITTKFLLNWILVFMLVKISWLGTFDMFYMIHKLHLEVERKFDKYKAVYFFVFAFDKDNTVYFPAGDQQFGDNSGLLY